MANENGQEKRETHADIVAEMRRRIAVKMSDAWYTQDEWRNLCDRLEAAWKREKAEWEAAACACVSDAVMSGSVAVEHVPVGNAAATRDALRALRDASRDLYNQILNSKYSVILDEYTCVKQGFPAVLDLRSAFQMANAALSEPPRKGKWENGTKYEYEYAYCSECGRMQWAGWDTHKQAEENIESFANDYKFCPGCGAEMEGGVYVQ